jgi:hypothetical protein
VQYLAANNLNTEGWVDYLASTLGPLPISRNTRQLLISYAGGTSQDAPWVVARTEEGRLRGVIPLLMATPEYQVC